MFVNHSPRCCLRVSRQERAFALVATVSLLVLVALVCLGLLSLSSLSLRGGQKAEAQSRAQANARMALMMAIGQLQKEMGPDQRVSASASILDGNPVTEEIDGISNPNWVGVWSTKMGGDTIVSRYESPEYLSDRRNAANYAQRSGNWRDQLFRKWLVSGEGTDARSQWSGDSVRLVGEGTVSRPEDFVSVPLVAANHPNSSGRMAWWVGDQALKASLDGPRAYAGMTPNKGNPTQGGYYNLMGAQRANLVMMADDSSGHPYDNASNLDEDALKKILSYKNSAFVKFSANKNSKALQDAMKSHFHELGTGQYSVFSDPVKGGLKKDLTTLMEGPVAGVPAVNADLPAVSSEKGLLTGKYHNNTGPKFAHLRSWYRLRDSLIYTGFGSATSAPIINPQISGAGYGFSKEGQQYDFVAARKPALTPFLTDCKLQWDFSRRGPQYEIRTHLLPSVTLWNPYNVTLKGRRYIVAITRPEGIKSDAFKIGGKVVLPLIGSTPVQLWGPTNFFLCFVTDPVDMGPGEALVFSPNVSAGTNVIGGLSIPYDGVNLEKNRLSATEVPMDGANFCIDVDAKADPTANLTEPIVYGFDDNHLKTSWYDLIFFLKDGGSSGGITLSNFSSAPTVQRSRANYNGDTTSYFSYVFKPNNHPANNAAYPGFSDYSAPDRKPPRLWYMHIRNRWYNEGMEKTSIGQNWGQGGAQLYDVPSVSLYNMRAPIEHRDAFSFYDDWCKYSPVGRMLPWASEVYTGNPDFKPTYVGGKNLGSPYGPPGIWTLDTTSFPLFDIPNRDTGVLSLASFQHAQLSYLPWHPSYVVGNSFADPRADRNHSSNAAYLASTSNWGPGLKARYASAVPVWDSLILNANGKHDISTATGTGGKPEELIYDIAYEVNNELWDSYFLSSIPFRPASNDTSVPSVNWSANSGNPLPMGRNVLHRYSDKTPAQIDQALGGDWSYAYYRAGAFLMNQGGFNVHSTSVEAWKAVLGSLSTFGRPTVTGADTAPGTFSRFLVPCSPESGAAKASSSAAWQGVRSLSDAEIELLAEKICIEVKRRAPFAGLSDFVNRRLVAAANDPDDTSLMGPLQAAIERAELNSRLSTAAIDLTATEPYAATANTNTLIGGGGYRMDTKAQTSSKAAGFPGYLTQGDILQGIGPMLTARGDTFVIRAYGEACDPSGRVLAKAWCEASLQRTPNFLQGSNAPETPVTTPTVAGSDVRQDNPALTVVNRMFGREFKVTSFRWLSPSEV